MRIFIVPICIGAWGLALVAGCGSGQDTPEPAATNRAATTTTAAASVASASQTAAREPEEVVRELLVAMMRQNGPKIQALILPNDEWEMLLQVKGSQPPPEILNQMENQLRQVKFRRAQIGETFTLPKGQRITFTSDWVNDDRQQILAQDMPTPVTVVRTGGEWRADAGVFIAGRKAAQAYEQTQGRGPRNNP